MGLMIHSLNEVPIEATRSYYIYVLDYGWHEPLDRALIENFGKMSAEASVSNSVVFRGTVGSHFTNEVFSFHQIGGVAGEDVLPAILITDIHPQYFKEHGNLNYKLKSSLILIPLKQICKTTSDVVDLIRQIFSDIKDKKTLSDFSVNTQVKSQNSIARILILQPNFSGIGIDIKKLFDFFKKPRNEKK